MILGRVGVNRKQDKTSPHLYMKTVYLIGYGDDSLIFFQLSQGELAKTRSQSIFWLYMVIMRVVSIFCPGFWHEAFFPCNILTIPQLKEVHLSLFEQTANCMGGGSGTQRPNCILQQRAVPCCVERLEALIYACKKKKNFRNNFVYFQPFH